MAINFGVQAECDCGFERAAKDFEQDSLNWEESQNRPAQEPVCCRDGPS